MDCEPNLARELAHSDKEIRDNAVSKLKNILLSAPSEDWVEKDYLKFWKALYFCFWMSDKPLIQQELAEQLTGIISQLKDTVALSYINGFWKTMAIEWHGIDRLRLNKFYMLLRKMHSNTFTWLQANDSTMTEAVLKVYSSVPLSVKNLKVPDSLRYHTIKVFFSSLSEVCNEPMETDIQPFLVPILDLLRASDNQKVLDQIQENVLDLYIPEAEHNPLAAFIGVTDLAAILYALPKDKAILHKNKKFLSLYLKEWGSKVGIPFIDTIKVTSMDVVDVQLDPEVALPVAEILIAANSVTPFKKATKAQKLKPKDKRKKDADIDEEVPQPKKSKNKTKVVSNSNVENPGTDYEERMEARLAAKATGSHIVKAISSTQEVQDGSPKKVSAPKPKVPIVKSSKGKSVEEVISKVPLVLAPKDTAEVSENVPEVTEAAPIKAKKAKKNKKKVTKEENAYEELVEMYENDQQKSPPANAFEADESLTDSAKKSVTWGPSKIKPFYKKSTICSNREAQEKVVVSVSAPKVLKKTKGKILIQTFTAGNRKSSRIQDQDY